MSNSIICDVDTPDPWMLAANNNFYLTFTLGDRIEIWASDKMEDFRHCQKSMVWKPQPGSEWSADVWAPELHRIHDQWYIYFCAAHPQHGNTSHRTLILRSWHPDPMQADAWTFLGPLKGLPDHWNIDATIINSPNGELWCCYSGWPLGDHSDKQQDLFIIRLASPEVAIPETLTCISRAELPWERADGGQHGVNEGPTWVDIPAFRGIVYSANGSWTRDYQLGLVRLVGNDWTKESSWQKRPTPLLVSGQDAPPYGPGHASFINSPYGDGRIYCIYHGTAKPDDGWKNRKARVICFSPEHFHPEGESRHCGDFATQHQHESHGNPPPSQPVPAPSQSHHSKQGNMVEDLGNKAKAFLKDFHR